MNFRIYGPELNPWNFIFRIIHSYWRFSFHIDFFSFLSVHIEILWPTTVWIKLIHFINIILNKRVFEVLSSTKKIIENFLFVEVSYECVVVACWKKFIRQTQSPYPSSLLEILKPQLLIQFIKRGTLNGICYC